MLKYLFISLLILSSVSGALNRNFVDAYVYKWLEKDSTVSKHYLKANIDDPYCCYLLGTIYLVEKNTQLADYYITKAANANSPEAINSIGDGYYSGDIRMKNHKKALECYVKSAGMGYGPAQFNAGAVYSRYAKSKKDLRKAIYWFNKASKNNDIKELKKYVLICKNNAIERFKEFNKNN